jgi:hypothetical protein
LSKPLDLAKLADTIKELHRAALRAAQSEHLDGKAGTTGS